jgi:thiol-disulfide isomerase/thioredoxin
MKKISFLLLAILAMMVLYSCTPTPPPHRDDSPTPVLSWQPKTSLPMPPSGNARLAQLGWMLQNGEHATIGKYQDKILVLDFYATWCMPCRQSIPQLIELEKRYGPKGLVVVGLNVGGPDDLSEVPGFAKEFNIQYPLGVPDEALTQLLMSDIDGIPQTFVFDGRGQLLKRYIGYDQSMDGELDNLIRSKLETTN